MTEATPKRRKLSLEILGLVAICLVISLLLFLLILHLGIGIVEEYCFYRDIILDEYELYRLDTTMFSAGLAVSVAFFIILFFALFGERLAYIRKITDGVHALRRGERDTRVTLMGNNELTELALAVNYLSESEQRIKEKEKKLNEEREELIRTLSHDIRTPLTSMMSYTELLAAKDSWTAEEIREYLALVSKKSTQIKELTAILLDGGRREVERFEDARLLFEQLADEFESELEDHFRIVTDLSRLPPFSGHFDVGELRRIFDNLISNIKKYSDLGEDVQLSISKADSGIAIRQSNGVRQNSASGESYQMGLNSIRRIAQHYAGTVDVSKNEQRFEIMITLTNI